MTRWNIAFLCIIVLAAVHLAALMFIDWGYMLTLGVGVVVFLLLPVFVLLGGLGGVVIGLADNMRSRMSSGIRTMYVVSGMALVGMGTFEFYMIFFRGDG